jgi:hypothetical protein
MDTATLSPSRTGGHDRTLTAKPKDKQYKLTDGDGLFLLVHPNGGRYWRFKYRFNGQDKYMTFGTYPEVSLGDAREKRRLNRILVRKVFLSLSAAFSLIH